MQQQVVEVEQFFDASCPWCHGGLETSRRLLDELAADPELPHLRLQWRFMRLHPLGGESGMSLDAFLGRWAQTDEQLAQAREDVRSYVRSVGTWVDFTRYTAVHDPRTAHRLLALVRDDGGDDLPSLWSLARAVATATFVHGVDIDDHAALRGGVERAGLVVPVRIWEQVADGDGGGAAVDADHARALEVELDGVPRMVVGGRIVPTWIDPAEVRAALREAILAAC